MMFRLLGDIIPHYTEYEWIILAVLCMTTLPHPYFVKSSNLSFAFMCFSEKLEYSY